MTRCLHCLPLKSALCNSSNKKKKMSLSNPPSPMSVWYPHPCPPANHIHTHSRPHSHPSVFPLIDLSVLPKWFHLFSSLSIWIHLLTTCFLMVPNFSLIKLNSFFKFYKWLLTALYIFLCPIFFICLLLRLWLNSALIFAFHFFLIGYN